MRRRYGAGPGQLLALLGGFALSGYAVSRLLDDLPVLLRIGIWFVGAAVVWDLLLGPALVSGLLLLVWAPLVLSRSQETYERKSGLSAEPYLARWLAVTAVLFALSGVVYGVSRLRARARA